jgi:cytochrome P450
MEMDLDGDPTYEDITKMPYLEAATWELLRLAAAAPSTNRKALVDVNVLGHV